MLKSGCNQRVIVLEILMNHIFFIIICTYFTNFIHVLSNAHLKIKLSHACADSEVNITK